MRWRRILLSVADPQGLAAPVLVKAGQLARGLDAELELFHSVFDANTVRAGRLLRVVQADIVSRVNEARRRLERSADTLRDQGIRARTCVRWDYPPPEAVVRQVMRSGADLLITASGRRTRATPIKLTYSDFRLIQACPCPVLIIKTARPYRRSAILAALDPREPPAESPTLDDIILTSAQTLSSALKTPLHACHAVPPLLIPVAGTAAVVAADAQGQTAHVKAARQRTRTITDDHALPPQRVHVAQGIPEAVVGSLAGQMQADIVAIGSVSLARSRDVLGRIAERLLDALDCDILVLKPPGYRSPVARQSIPTPALRRRATAAAS